MDKVCLDLISIVLGGTGVFVALTKASFPEANQTFLGNNPFAIKRDIIGSRVEWMFGTLAVLGLLVQVGAIIWGEAIKDRQHSPGFYRVFFVIVVALTVAVAWVLRRLAYAVARRAWLPRIVQSQRELYRRARSIVEQDGWRKEQIATKDEMPDSEHYRGVNFASAATDIEQIEKLLGLGADPGDLRARLDRLKPHFGE